MRWNMNCIRDILLCIEENTGLRKRCFFVDEGLTSAAQWLGTVTPPPDYQGALLQEYGNDTLIYHVHYCLDSGLAVRTTDRDEYKIWVADLTPEGHEFLAKIRDNNVWAKTKDMGTKIGSFSLSMVSKIAEGVATALLKQHLGLP